MSQPVTTRPQENAAGAGPNAAKGAPSAVAVSRRRGPASRSQRSAREGGKVRSIAAHTTWMTGRQLKAIARQPAYVVIMLIQPVIWLFLFGSLFRKVVDLPGFGS